MQCTDKTTTTEMTLPITFDADSALECSQLAMGLAYQPDVGLRLVNALRVEGSPSLISVGTSNIAFAKTRGRNSEELVIVNRGTIINNVEDARRNFAGQVRTDHIFVGKRSSGEDVAIKSNRRFAQLMVHGQYLDRAMGVLFTYLLLDAMKGVYRIGDYKQVTVTGHSQGGAVSICLAALLVGFDAGLRALKDGHIDALEVNDTSSSVDAFTKGDPTASTLSITLDQDAEQFVVKWSGAWTHETRWDVSSALLHRQEAAAPGGPVRVYAFAPTKISNPAFEAWIHENVPSTFNFIMRFDPVAQMVLPWNRRPGNLIEVRVRKNEWLRWLTFPFLEAWLNMSPWLPACCAEKGTYGGALHSGATILPAVTAFLLESPAVAKKASLDAVWNELKYFLVFEEWFGGDASSFVSWFRLQTSKFPDKQVGATDRLLILKDGSEKGLDDFEYTIRTFSGARALTWSRVYFNGTLMLTFFVLVPMALLLLGVLLLLSAVAAPIYLTLRVGAYLSAEAGAWCCVSEPATDSASTSATIDRIATPKPPTTSAATARRFAKEQRTKYQELASPV